MASMRSFATLALLALGIVAAYSANVNEATTLTVASGACSGVEVDGLNPKFDYKVQLNSLSDQSCANSIRLSKFYIEGACLKTRDNQIGLNSVKDINCAEANSNDQNVCKNVFSTGPSSDLLTIGTITAGQTFDSGKICANQNKGYVYVQSNCTSTADISVTFNQNDYSGPVCLNIAGHHLSGWAIAIIVVVVVIVLFLAFWAFWCCCCGSCCCL